MCVLHIKTNALLALSSRLLFSVYRTQIITLFLKMKLTAVPLMLEPLLRLNFFDYVYITVF